MVRLSINRAAVADFCKRHHIKRLRLFGSVLRDDFRPDSEVDVLVEFEEGHVPGLAFFDMENELSGILCRTVDLNTLGFLGAETREEALREGEVQYDASAACF